MDGCFMISPLASDLWKIKVTVEPGTSPKSSSVASSTLSPFSENVNQICNFLGYFANFQQDRQTDRQTVAGCHEPPPLAEVINVARQQGER